jgi:hypothetical protein
VHRDFIEAQLDRGLVSCVSADDDAIGIDDDWLAEAELADARRHCIDGIVQAWIARIGLDRRIFRNSIFIGVPTR